ncbi:unnamed protein product [Lepeophtheirus salmonis]|uniref:(salmon louse) hypothetical protein n=1 Tax=Lepeophtheirus salmonis TaxID=72036 RepID=A0A7R8HC16_LEPSM|nr:unnamed protein product [Lepeophtheirus salmonis]CAF2981355.1 unnamed protein product [Lepeophtheirus salmonis]
MDMEFTVTNLKDNFSLKKNDDLGDQNNFKKSERKKNCTVVETVEMDLSADEDSVFLSTSKSDMGLCSKQERVNVPKNPIRCDSYPNPLLNQVVPIESKGTMDIKNETKNSANDQSIIGHEDGLTKINKICNLWTWSFTVTNRKKQFPLKNHADLGDQNNFKKSERKNCTVVEAVEMDLSADEDSVFLSTSKSDMGLCSKQEGVNVSKKTDSLRQLPESFHYKNNLAESELKTSVKSKIHGQEKHSGDYDLMGFLNAKKIRMMPSGNDLIKTHLHNELEIVNSGSHVRNEDDYKKRMRTLIDLPHKKLMPTTALTPVFKTISKEKDVESMKLSPSSFFESSKSKMTKSNAHELHSKNENTRCSQDTTSDLNAFINGSNLERENCNNSSYSETYNSFRVDVSGEDSVKEKNNPCMKPIINIFNYYEKEQLSFEDGYKYTDFHIEQMSDHLVTLSFMEGKFKLDFYIEKLCSVEEKENILIQHCKINDVVGLVQYTQSDAFVNMVLGLVDSILLKSNMLKGIMRITNRFKDFLGLIRSHLSSACKMIIAETKIFHSHPGSGLDKKNPKVYRVLFSGFYFYFRMNINFESGLDYIRKSVSCSLSEGMDATSISF